MMHIVMTTRDLMTIVGGAKTYRMRVLLGVTKKTTTDGNEDSTIETLVVMTIVIDLTTSTNRDSHHTPMTTTFIVKMTVTIKGVAMIQGVGEKRDAGEDMMAVTNILDVWMATTIHRNTITRMKMVDKTVIIVETNMNRTVSTGERIIWQA